MFNSEIPSRAELPSTAQLIKSTAIAVVAAVVILVTIVLPAEYGVDPTGIGRPLGLTQMGEIKRQLADEAAADRRRHSPAEPAPAAPRSSLVERLFAQLLIGPAQAQAVPERSDETIITLQPTEGVEWKMTMVRGAQVRYSWSVQGGTVNYDMHGTPRGGGRETSYRTARGIASDEGVMTAGFDGSHGWFFRNRGSRAVTITLRTSGPYVDLRRVQ